MRREGVLLLVTGVGAVVISIGVLSEFIALETQTLLVEYRSILNGSRSVRPIVRVYGVDLLMLGLLALSILILLAALLQSRNLSWLTSLGLGAAITTVSVLIGIRSFVGLHVEKYGIPFGWLVIVYRLPPGGSYIYGVVIQAYLIDLIIWGIVAKALISRLISEQIGNVKKNL